MSTVLTRFLKSKKSIVLSGQGISMFPFLKEGDKVYIKRLPYKKIQENDIIVFIRHKIPIAHRVIYKQGTQFVTRGDNTLIDDKTIKKNDILGKIVKIKKNNAVIRLDQTYLIQSTFYLQEIIAVKNSFEKEKIEFVFLKGLPLHLYYEKTHPRRIYADCDVLIDGNNFAKAETILSRHGYNRSKQNMFGLKEKEMTECAYYKNLDGFTVIFDLHCEVVFQMTQIGKLNLLYPNNYIQRLTQEVLKHKQSIIIYKKRFFILSSNDLILYLSLHIFHHNFKGANRYRFLDTVIRKTLSQQADSNLVGSTWGRVAAQIVRYKLENFIYPVFLLLKKFYKTPVPQSFMKKICPTNFFAAYWGSWIYDRGSIFNDEPRMKAGINRFCNLFVLSPSPWWKKMGVWFHPQVVHAVIWVIGGKLFRRKKQEK